MPNVYGYQTFPKGGKPEADDLLLEVRVFNHPYDEEAEAAEADRISVYYLNKHAQEMRDKHNNSNS